ncbi:MAG: hypothetical protein WKF41_05770 [Gaiellaceae bacterium]
MDESAASSNLDEQPQLPTDPVGAGHAGLLEEYLRTAPDSLVHVLRPLAALGEVIAVCESIRTGRRPPQLHDRNSLRADVQRALTGLGPELRRALEPTRYDYFHGELADLPDLLHDTRGGVIRLLNATKILRERLLRPVSSQAAWRDLLAAARGGLSEEVARLRALQLREIEEALGHEWRWREMRLRELVRAGEFDDVEEVLLFPPSRGAQVAWFIFADADIPNGYLRVGQVQFFSHRLWPEAVMSQEYMARIPEADLPFELDEFSIVQIKPNDDAEHHVYARVELTGPRAQGTRNPWAHGRAPQAWARELVSAIVDAGTFRIGGSAWKLLAGVAVYAGTVSDASGTFGNWGGSFGFVDSAEYDNEPSALPLHEGTGEALESLDKRFADLVAEGDATAIDAIGEVRWYEATRKQVDPAQRVALHVRAFERALPMPGHERWNDAVKRYFCEFWALDQFDSELFELAHDCELAIRRHDHKQLDRLEQWLVRDDLRFTISLGAFLRTAAKIEPLIPRTSRFERRRLREAAKYAAHPAAAHERLREFEQRFMILLDRALRQRNAVVHGVKTVSDVVASVDRFVARIAGYVVAQSVEGAGTGEDLIEAIERGRARSRLTVWRLDNGEMPVDRVLYGVEHPA